MIKKAFMFFGLLITSMTASAGFIEEDWQSVGDRKLTLFTELNLEILDVSLSASGPVAVSNELKNGSLYSGFRYMSSSELHAILNSLLGGTLDTRNASGYVTSEESIDISNFLNLINGSNFSFFNTCNNALSCDLYPWGDALINGQRHIITPKFIYFADDSDTVEAQLLVRERNVPEPATILLLALGVLGLWSNRKFKAYEIQKIL